MEIKNIWVQFLLLSIVGLLFTYLILKILGIWYKNNNFTKTKRANQVLVLFGFSMAIIFGGTALNDSQVLDDKHFLEAVIAVLSTFVVPVILGIMFTTTKYGGSDDNINSRVEKINEKKEINLGVWKFESQKEITLIHNFTGPDMNNEVHEDFIETETISESKVHKQMSDDELDRLEKSLLPVAEVILSETVDGESVADTKDIVEAINKQ